MKMTAIPVHPFISRWVPPLLVMGVIFFFSSRSDLPGAGVDIVWWDFFAKKLAHIMEYALLFYTLQRAFNWNKPEEARLYWQSFLIVLIYASLDELHQAFIPTRHPQPRDVAIDLLGAFLVYLRLKRFV